MSKNRFIPFSRPWIDETEIAAVSEVLASQWISTGAKVREFERAFAEYIGVLNTQSPSVPALPRCISASSRQVSAAAMR